MRSMGAASMAALTPSLCNGQHCNVDVSVTCTSSAQCIQVIPVTLVVQNSAQPSIHFRMQSEGFQFERISFDDPQFTCTPGPREVVCMDRHSSAGTFKYSVAIRGVAGVLDPFVVNN